MAKRGCGNCGKPLGQSGHATVLECMQGSVPAPTVERIHQTELAAPKVTSQDDTVASQTLKVAPQGNITKQERWRVRNSDRYKAYRREYMRRRRAAKT